jgi:hypothetical protein
MFAQIRKALVPLIVAIVLTGLGAVGVIPTPEVVTTITLIVTSVLVYFIPNEA